MSEIKENRIQYYVLICDRKKKNKFIELLVDYGAKGIQTVYGKGSANSGIFAGAFGLETEEKKAVLTALLTTENAKKLTDTLCNEYNFHRANTGIAFSIPVEGISF